MITKIYFTAILTLGLSFFASAQFVIDMSQADVITYNDYEIEFYKQIEEDKFVEIHLKIDKDKDGILIPNVYEEKNEKYWRTLGELKRNRVLFTKDLATFSKEKFIDYVTQSEWIIKDTVIRHQKYQTFFSAFNKDIMTVKNTSFTKEKGDLLFWEDIKKKKGKKWVINGLEWYQIIILSFGNDRYIATTFNAYNNLRGMFFPLKNKENILINNLNIRTVLPSKIKRKQKNERIASAHFKEKKFYKIIKSENDMYQLLTVYGKKITESEYDTILHNNLFFICKNEETEKVDIYRSTLEKLNIPNLKSAYLLENGLEVLTEKAVSYYNWEGKKVRKLTSTSHWLCGTGYHSFYHLASFKNADSSHFLVTGGFSSQDNIVFLFSAFPPSYQLYFLNNESTLSSSPNSLYVPEDFFKVKNKNKYGLFSYDLDYMNLKVDTIITSESTLRNGYETFNCQITPTKEILPIVYDSMVLGGANKLVFLYQGNKIGIYPNFEKPVFDKVERKTPSFYAILRNGKKGWLDINTFKEYYFD